MLTLAPGFICTPTSAAPFPGTTVTPITKETTLNHSYPTAAEQLPPPSVPLQRNLKISIPEELAQKHSNTWHAGAQCHQRWWEAAADDDGVLAAEDADPGWKEQEAGAALHGSRSHGTQELWVNACLRKARMGSEETLGNNSQVLLRLSPSCRSPRLEHTQGCIPTCLPCSLSGPIFWPINKFNYETHGTPGWWGLDISNPIDTVLDEADLEKDKKPSPLTAGSNQCVDLGHAGAMKLRGSCSAWPWRQKQI